MLPDVVSDVADALAREVSPDTVSLLAVVVASVEVPVVVRVLRLVSEETERLEVEALARVVCPVAVSVFAVRAAVKEPVEP